MREQPRDRNGRYAPFEREIRSRRLDLRLTPSEHAVLKAAADRRQCSVTELIVQLIRKPGMPYTVKRDAPPPGGADALARARRR